MPYFHIRRVVLRNYRSVAACDVTLPRLAFLVGPNGSGKSNFLDALRLIMDSLTTTLDHALRDRGGIQEVRRRSPGHPTHFTIQLEFLYGASAGSYEVKVGSVGGGGFEVSRETCSVESGEIGGGRHHYEVRAGTVVRTSATSAPPVARDRLYLVTASGLPEFRPIFDGLSSMGFYNLVPDRIRAYQSPDAGQLLTRDGSNAASVLARLARLLPERKATVEDYLRSVVPGVTGVDRTSVGPMETMTFFQDVGAGGSWRFPASNMSDGTLRALGILLALFQAGPDGSTDNESLIGIEEPELALHPAAAGVLRDALRDAAHRRQVLVTSHSPELLDDPDLALDALIAVQSVDGRTVLGALDQAGRYALEERLFTAGELLRLNQLAPESHPFEPLPGF